MRAAELLVSPQFSDRVEALPSVVSLDAGLAAPQLVGPKAANLIALRHAGFSTPRGVVVTSAAFEAFLREAHLAPEWERLQEALDPARPLPDDSNFSVWRTRVRSAPIPAGLRTELEAALTSAGLLERGLAVRSSALLPTSDDGLPAAEAQLHVVGIAAIERALRRAWAALWEPRKLERLREQRTGELPSTAVLLQELVAAEVSGTVTTANPATGLDDEAVVHALFGLHDRGLGERARADRYVASLWTGSARSAQLGMKSIQVLPANGGGTRDEVLPPQRARSAALTAEQLRAVVSVAASIHERAGRPVRIGFVLSDNNQVTVLDARPLDRLRFAPGLGEWRRGAEVMVRGRELRTQLTSSLHASALERAVRELATEARVTLRRLPFHRTLFGRLYWNIGEARRASVASGLAAINEAALRWRAALRHLRAFRRHIQRVRTFMRRAPEQLRPFDQPATHLTLLPADAFAGQLQLLATSVVAGTESLAISTAAKLFVAEAALRRSVLGSAGRLQRRLPEDALASGEVHALVERARELESLADRLRWPSRWLLRLRVRRVLELAECHLSLQQHLARGRVLLRRWTREAGRRLASERALERSEHIVHLGLDAIVSGLQQAASIESVRAQADFNRRIHRAFRNFEAPRAVNPATPLERHGDDLLTF